MIIDDLFVNLLAGSVVTNARLILQIVSQGQLGDFRLKNINFNIHKGEIFAVPGKTGSGKTVLLESIAGFYRSSGGK